MNIIIYQLQIELLLSLGEVLPKGTFIVLCNTAIYHKPELQADSFHRLIVTLDCDNLIKSGVLDNEKYFKRIY
jgi:hypothetical protein